MSNSYQYCVGVDNLSCNDKPFYLLDNMFIFFISTLGGFFSSYALVAHLVSGYYNYIRSSSESFDEEDEDDFEDEDLENRYYDELNLLENREMTKEELDGLLLKSVDVETPDGLVKMTYNNKMGSFWYYSDNKNVHYKYLDSIARYFTIQNNCRQICVNYKEEYEKSVLSLKEQFEEDARRLEEKNNDTVPKKKSVFAQFKNYKKVDTKNKKQYVLVDKANQFKHVGTMSDYEYEKNKKEKKTETTIPTLDYATFKRMLSQQAQAQVQVQVEQAQVVDQTKM
jgi:hypothetical protein